MNRYLTPAQTVTWVGQLGYPEVTEATVRSWAHRRHIATHHTPKGVRYDAFEVQEYLAVRVVLDRRSVGVQHGP